MVLAASRTFDYVAIVPERSGDTDFECRARLRDPLAIHRLGDSWLVGITPVIRVTDAGLTPDAHPARPWVMRSRITLQAPEPRQASAAEASFHVDQALTSCMKPGDEIPQEKPHLFDVASRKGIPIDDKLFDNPWSITDVRWQPDSSRFTFVYNQRGHQVLRIVVVDAGTGESAALIDDKSDTFIDYAHKQFAHYADKTAEIIWMGVTANAWP